MFLSCFYLDVFLILTNIGKFASFLKVHTELTYNSSVQKYNIYFNKNNVTQTLTLVFGTLLIMERWMLKG